MGALAVGIIAAVSLFANLGLMVAVYLRGSRKSVFIGFDPGDRSLVPRPLKGATKRYIWRHPDGRVTFFPLPKGYGHTWGKNKTGTAYIGDLSTGQPITWEVFQKVEPSDGDARAGRAMPVKATRQVDPGGDYMAEVLRDNREIKMLTASRQAQGSGLNMTTILLIAGIALAAIFILPKLAGGG